MRLRLIEERDLDAVRRLRNENRDSFFFNREVSEEQHRRWFENLLASPMQFYVMEEDGDVVGTISVIPGLPAGNEIGNLIVGEAHRGRGFALQALTGLTTEPGTYFSNVLPENDGSLTVLARVGFAPEHVVMVKTVEP